MLDSSHDFHPVLEALEDRTALAADVVTSPVPPAAPVVPDTQPTQLSPVAPDAGANALLNQTTLLREIATQPAVIQTLGTTNATVPTIEDVPPSTFSNQNPPPQTAQAPSSYAGRLALAGTGVQQRVAFGDGPFTQAPGLFLVGGGDQGLAATPQIRPEDIKILLMPAPEGVSTDAAGEQVAVSQDDAEPLPSEAR